MNFKYYKELILKDKNKGLKELINISNTDLAISLIKVFGYIVYTSLNEELKNNNEIIVFVFKNFKEQSINIFKKMDTKQQEQYFYLNPKSFYSHLKNPKNDNITKILLDNYLIEFLDEDAIKQNYDYISELILKNINIIQYSHLHFNDENILAKIIEKYDLKDVKKIFVLNNNLEIINAAINYFNDKEKIILFIKKDKQIIMEFLSQNINYISKFRQQINTYNDYLQLSLLNTNSIFFSKILDEINTFNEKNILEALIQKRADYILTNLSNDDQMAIMREAFLGTLVFFRNQTINTKNNDEENFITISTLILILIICECNNKITFDDMFNQLLYKIKETINRKKMTLPSEIFLNRIANTVSVLQKKEFFKKCSLEYLVLLMIFCDDNKNFNIQHKSDDPLSVKDRLKLVLTRVSKDFKYINIENNIFSLNCSFLDISNIQKTLNQIILFNNIFLEQPLAKSKLKDIEKDTDNILAQSFSSFLVCLIECFVNNRKDLSKTNYMKSFLPILDYYNSVALKTDGLEKLCKMKF